MRNGVRFIVKYQFSSYYGILFFQIFFKSFIYDDGYPGAVARLFMHGWDGLRYFAKQQLSPSYKIAASNITQN